MGSSLGSRGLDKNKFRVKIIDNLNYFSNTKVTAFFQFDLIDCYII